MASVTDVPTRSAKTRKQPTTQDTRASWRTLLAVVVPLPWLAKGVQYMIDAPHFERGADLIAYDQTHHAYQYLQWLDALFVVLVVPSVITMAFVARRGAPRLATAAAILMGGGFLLVLPLNNGGVGDWLGWAAARKGLDPATTGVLLDSLVDPRQSIGSAGFAVAILFGSIVTGLALWKSRAVPAWAALCVALGGATHMFLQFNHVVHGAGLVVLAAGCVRISLTLVRMTDDDFDLRPFTERTS